MGAAPGGENSVPELTPRSTGNPLESGGRNGAGRWMQLPRHRRRKVLFLAVYGLFLWGVLAVGVRIFWRSFAGVPLTETASVWDYYYPELRLSGLRTQPVSNTDERYDVLLLGGSALETSWGNVEQNLAESLRRELGERFRIVNFARSAQTSRDSLLKHAQLEGNRFDLVIVYDGMNDVRMNVFPKEKFREDYSHCAWYRGMTARLQAGTISLSDVMRARLETVGEAIGLGPAAPEYFAEAAEVKTGLALEKNQTALLATAAARGERVLLMTVAWHLPADYSFAQFQAGHVDYTLRADGRSCPVEMWGRPDLVAMNIEAHNATIRRVAELHPEALFVDQRVLVPATRENFSDVCHFSAQGSRVFVANLLRQLQPELARFRGDRGKAGPAPPSAEPRARTSTAPGN